MNATPMTPNPATAVQVQPAAGKPQDSAAQDVPFSQVLSSEIAQKRNSSEAREGADAKADAEAEDVTQAAGAAPAGEEATASAAAKVKEAGKSARDPQPDESSPTTPDILLALALHPDMLKPAPAATDSTLPEQTAAAGTPAILDSRSGRAPQAGLTGDKATAKQKIDAHAAAAAAATLATTATANVSATATATAMAAATAISEQAAARKADVIKTGELLPDLMNLPAMRMSAHVAPPALESAGASLLTPSVGTTAWNQALGEKIVWMAAGAQQTASLTLNPPNMGPLQIVLSVSNDQATANFFSAQPEVRQALEAAFPRLREMMNDAGIQLGQATVSADTPRQNDTPDRQAQWTAPAFAGEESAAGAALQGVHAPVQQSGRGLVDTFA